MKVTEANKIALHVSGTASIDERGRTAHPGDFDAQADRMLLNVAAPICRPELECETEALAILPRATTAIRGGG
jgi:hypothetical protein